ncbi:YqaJ viral recombinase family protein [Rhodohalobacter sp.]|uniref:YqaJ viral recombinase family protein n=1 Tax=Rhodohalobacter sp. TaxID=1974210 RepID=UPI002ACE2443|nr:YqaJ viral recombinase family protein [Rhodohalobacter sp.]MDZ7757222.1 YqaJ viral recombinase family protein [Rhodohalobacter sp.]
MPLSNGSKRSINQKVAPNGVAFFHINVTENIMNEISTKELSIDEWRSLRRNFIGGSDSFAALGNSRYKSPYMVWLEKTQNVSFFHGNAFSNFGILFEPIVRQHFRETMNMEVTEPETMFIPPDYPMLSGNVDGIINDEGNLGLGILEIKCTTTLADFAPRVSAKHALNGMHSCNTTSAFWMHNSGTYKSHFRDTCEFAEPIFVSETTSSSEQTTGA